MTDHKFLHSVYLKTDLCNGCINCIKRCPTQAIRVRNRKAAITSEYCIDCGECILICPHHAKASHYDRLDILNRYKYTVALPDPVLYSQFNNLSDINIVLTALMMSMKLLQLLKSSQKFLRTILKNIQNAGLLSALHVHLLFV